MNLSGKRIIITGSSQGLGLATVEKLSEQGAHVIGMDKVIPASNRWKGKAFLQCNITDSEELEDAFSEAVRELGGIDILINNAGSLALQDAGQEPTEKTLNSFNDNFWALWKITSLALPYLRECGGKVINISSLFACVNAPLVPGYATSKRAVVAFSDSLRMQYGNEITVTTLYPGFIDTGIHRDAVRQGLSVAKIVKIRFFNMPIINFEEPLDVAASGVVRACKHRYRDAALTLMGSLSLWSARHFPAVVDFIISQRISHLVKQGELHIKLDAPSYE